MRDRTNFNLGHSYIETQRSGYHGSGCMFAMASFKRGRGEGRGGEYAFGPMSTCSHGNTS